MRFREVLDPERLSLGERSPKVTLANGSQSPLSLKRSLSQACDPHRAYLLVEFGTFDETVGRLGPGLPSPPKGHRSSAFTYRVATKIPVDTVGVTRYSIDHAVSAANRAEIDGSHAESSSWIIVRVALHGGSKVVSFESPILIQNSSDADLLCEIRQQNANTLIWRSILHSPRLVGRGLPEQGSVSIPVDVVHLLRDDLCNMHVTTLPRSSKLRHESDVAALITSAARHGNIKPPPSFSNASVAKGLIEDYALSPMQVDPETGHLSSSRRIHLNGCSLRLGGFVSGSAVRTSERGPRLTKEIPEQRMIVLRSGVVVKNMLPHPVAVQARIRGTSNSEYTSEWIPIGQIGCGASFPWSGVDTDESFEIRVLLCGASGEPSVRFPLWSTCAVIPSSLPGTSSTHSATIKVEDTLHAVLPISVATCSGTRPLDSVVGAMVDVKALSNHVPEARRVLELYVPYWIVDSTGLDLQYKTRSIIAGQRDVLHNTGSSIVLPDWKASQANTVGLAELLESSEFTHLESRVPFDVSMLGDDGALRLHVRRAKIHHRATSYVHSPWSRGIPLFLDTGSHFDLEVLGPQDLLGLGKPDSADSPEPLALRCRIVPAPSVLGSSRGTKIVHLFSRYTVVNELGCDIEIATSRSGRGRPETIEADGRAKALHFNDTHPISFRPKEIGWLWSGNLNVSKINRELTVRVQHRLTERSLFASIECVAAGSGSGLVLVFKRASHSPYRVENRSMLALHYVQQVPFYTRRHSSSVSGSIVLPFHDHDFAWDEPENGDGSITVNAAPLGDIAISSMRRYIGSFNLDKMAPGSELDLGRGLKGYITADGPTKVLRIVDPAVAGGQVDDRYVRSKEEDARGFVFEVHARLDGGMGVSVVDWIPQELIYVRLDDMRFSLANQGRTEKLRFSVGSITADNQVWVTPFPVAARIGSSRDRLKRTRRQDAFVLSVEKPTKQVEYANLIVLEKVEVLCDPIYISMDGELVKLLLRFLSETKRLDDASRATIVPMIISRNTLLLEALGFVQRSKHAAEHDPEKTTSTTQQLFAAFEANATAAVAAKLRRCYQPTSQAIHLGNEKDSQRAQEASRVKYYIGKLRISSVFAQISWSGTLPLPSSFLRRLRPVLTFEEFPLYVRPFSMSHCYGTLTDHAVNLRAHYFSIWRLVDIVVGILEPTFLLRAWYFTTRDIFASSCATIASTLSSWSTALDSVNQKGELQWGAFSSVNKYTGRPMLAASTSMLGWYSDIFQTLGNLTRVQPSRGIVRSRNPRLFAKLDGKDLLVQYLEGENAGQALLSRARMGLHLGEVYVYHTEGAYSIQQPKDPLIAMLTMDRLLLMSGRLDNNFCRVVWEVSMQDLVHIETHETGTIALFFLHDVESSGLKVLQQRTIAVPDATMLADKLAMSVGREYLKE